MAESWYVQDAAGTVSGPFPEKQVAEALFSGKITDAMRLRQSDSDWCEASRVRSIFRQLFENGWYVRQGDQTHGPFTDAKLRELCQAGDVKASAEIRRGTAGPWRRVSETPGLSQLPPLASRTAAGAAELGSPVKWSTEPIHHRLLQLLGTGAKNQDGSPRTAIIQQCQDHERLLLQRPESSSGEHGLIRVTRTNGQQLGCLSAADTRQVLEKADRGTTYVVLLHSVESTMDQAASPRVQVAVVACPPGTKSEDSVHYIEQTLISSTP